MTRQQRDSRGRFVACVHHWAIEEPNGPTSKAVCMKCDARREFANATPHKKYRWHIRPSTNDMSQWPVKRK